MFGVQIIEIKEPDECGPFGRTIGVSNRDDQTLVVSSVRKILNTDVRQKR